MNTVKKAWKHFQTVREHRKWVKYYGEMWELSKWQAFTHDLSKYSPTEFFESVKYYQGNRSPIDACKEENEYSMAWFHHRGRNPHHYEFWQDGFDIGGYPVQMPYKYAKELLCDYLAAGRTYMKNKFSYHNEYNWWLNKRKNCAMHPQTKWFITLALEYCKQEELENEIENQRAEPYSSDVLLMDCYIEAEKKFNEGVPFCD
jgi:hypothetical protein